MPDTARPGAPTGGFGRAFSFSLLILPSKEISREYALRAARLKLSSLFSASRNPIQTLSNPLKSNPIYIFPFYKQKSRHRRGKSNEKKKERMSLQTPRILPSHLHAFSSKTVRVLGTVSALRGDTATITCGTNGDITLVLKADSHLQMGKLVEVVGKVTELDGSVCTTTTTAMTNDMGFICFLYPSFILLLCRFWIWGRRDWVTD